MLRCRDRSKAAASDLLLGLVQGRRVPLPTCGWEMREGERVFNLPQATVHDQVLSSCHSLCTQLLASNPLGLPSALMAANWMLPLPGRSALPRAGLNLDERWGLLGWLPTPTCSQPPGRAACPGLLRMSQSGAHLPARLWLRGSQSPAWTTQVLQSHVPCFDGGGPQCFPPLQGKLLSC